MSILYGVSIADPRKTNLRFSRIENDHYDVTRKEPGRPLVAFVSEQDQLNNFDRLMPSPKGNDTVKESTIPMSDTLNKDMIDLWRERRENLLADVEKPQLEADKYLVDKGMNKGAWFNPAGNYPVPTFKREDRPVLRMIRNPASRLANAELFARQTHYLYNDGKGSFRSWYYSSNPWKDSSGRIHLFDRPFTRIFA